MHEQTIRLFWKVWIVWMSSTINIFINNSKKMINYSFKMGTFSFGKQTAVEPKRLNWKSDLLESVADKQS